jgi:protein-L-isoaspartate(D-aspartate) O-methyltransferase
MNHSAVHWKLETRISKLPTVVFHPDLDARRHHMVETQLRQRGIRDQRVLAAMSRVPRHEFVGEPYQSQAYDDNPLPIGEGQTISQPYIVALMLELLDLAPEQTVLEIGTGSGYQAALLAELVRHVYSIERHVTLAYLAQTTLRRLGYANVTLEVGDGSAGLPAHAPYDGIVVAAAAPNLPRSLFDQLQEGGRLVIPVGLPEAQQLQLVKKVEAKPVIFEQTGCRFVPLIGEQGYLA